MPERRLLLISYLFPPAGGVAVQRALSLAKYLPRFGYRVTVLAAWNPATPVIDQDLVRQIPSQVRVERVFTPEIPFAVRQTLWGWLNRISGGGGSTKPATAPQQPRKTTSGGGGLQQIVQTVFCPDPEVVWCPFALHAATAIVKRERIDTVLVTAPPFSAFLTGAALKRRFPNICLVSDFRDSWLDFYLSNFDHLRGESVKRRSEAMERSVLESSDLVVTVTPSIVNELRSRYTDQPPGKFAMVVNGFDQEALSDFAPRAHGSGKIVVSYLGTLYPASSARYYLEALASLPPETARRFETRFIGRVTAAEKEFLDAHTASTVRQLGFMEQSKAFRLMEETDFVLVTMTDAASLTGKILEYLGMSKPILGFSPVPGEVHRILAETTSGWCAPLDDLEARRQMLLRAVRIVDGEEPLPVQNRAAVDAYGRAGLTQLYASLIDDCHARRGVIPPG